MPGGDQANFVVRGWRNLREAGARRLVLAMVLLLVALLLARFSWNLPWPDANGGEFPTPVTGEAERALYDCACSARAVGRRRTPGSCWWCTTTRR